MNDFLITESIHASSRAAKEVFKELGSGHSEVVYEAALQVELALRDVPGPIQRQVPVPIAYKGYTIGTGYIDLLIDDLLIIEIKTISKLTPKEEQQVRKYLTGTGLEKGLLINFGNDLEITEVHARKEPIEQPASTEGGDCDRPLLSESSDRTADPRRHHNPEITPEGSPGDLETS